MEVVPTATLPLLALPSGDTLKVRKRNNDLDELQEETLRIQIRQHLGASLYAVKSPPRRRERYRRGDSVRSSLTANDGGSRSSRGDDNDDDDEGGDGFDLSTLGAILAAPHRHARVKELLKVVQRILWVSDEDMDEEINDNDPKILAGKRFLKGVEAFSMLSENELAQLVGLSELRAYRQGDVVVDDEREADGLYIVLTGTATRFTMNRDGGGLAGVGVDAPNVDDDGGAGETFGYQEHFGTIISPTEAAHQTDRPETAVLATADLLECVWIPELVVRMLNIQPRMEYEFVLILHNHRFQREAEQRSQEELLLNLLRAGIHVTVLANTRNTTNYIVLLLSAPLWLLAREDKLLAMDRIVEHHAEEDTKSVGDDYEYHAETMSASDRIAAFASILTRSPSDKPPGAGLRGVEGNQDAVVKDVFPLHDPSMTDFILSTWFKDSHSSTTKRLFLLRVKDYFGLRIAFFTAFVRIYNSSLVYPMNAGCALWLFWRWIHYRTYVQALGIYGLCVAFVWAPSFLKRWSRYQNSLLVEWNLLGTTEVAQPNAQFRDYVVETINVANEGEPPDYVEVRTYDHRRRWPKYAIFGVFCVLCLLLLFVFVGAYVQWYIVAVMTPMCTDPRCPAFLDTPGGCELHCHELFAKGKSYLFMQQISSCASYCDTRRFDRSYYRCDAPLVGCFATERGIVGTARWFYVLVQGIVLGLTLDVIFLALFESIASGFNNWENYATELEKERRYIEKIFLFNWVGYFYWFFLLAFLYVPNGARVQEFVRERIDQSWVFTLNHNVRFSRYWVDGLISMDSAFVTPMIVTQALNLVINTFVPYLLRRAIVRARDSYHVKREQLSKMASTFTQRESALESSAVESSPAETIDLSTAVQGGSSSTTNLVDQWIAQSDLSQYSRQELASLLAQREPVRAEALDGAIHALFGAIASHDHHMQEICGGLTKDDLDSHQRTSYEWIDRVTRNIEARGNLKGLWDAAASATEGGGHPQQHSHSSAATAMAKALKLRLITQWSCRNYNYTADRVLEESSMPIYSPFGDLLHLAIQFSYTIMFSVVWPFCCLCSFCRNFVALRFDAIKMTIDCKRAVPRRTVGIGSWFGAFLFEILVALVVVPALFVYVSGQLDAFSYACAITEGRYGPADGCLVLGDRLSVLFGLENLGIALCFLVFLKKSDISHETSIKIVEHSRKLRHNLRKSVRMIGETILVATRRPHHHHHPHPGPTTTTLSLPAASISPPSSPRGVSPNKPISFADVHDPNALFAVDLNDRRDSLIANSSTMAAGPKSGLSSGLHRRRTTTPIEIAATKATLDASFGHHEQSTSAGNGVTNDHTIEWREGTVSWVKNGRIKVNFSGGRQLSAGGIPSAALLQYNESDTWLTANEHYVLMEPTPVKFFEIGAPVLLASKKFGRWMEATITGLDHTDRFGKELTYSPNEMHFRVIEGQNLRTHSVRKAGMIDPYCVLTTGTSFRHTTSVKRSTLNPIWDEQVVFPLLESELYGEPAANPRTQSRVVATVGVASSNTHSRASSRHATMDKATASFAGGVGSVTTATLHAAAAAIHPSTSTVAGGGGSGGLGASAMVRRTLKLSVLNNDQYAMGDCIGDVEIDLNQFRSGKRHRLLIPLSKKRHIWTLDAIESVMRKQSLGATEYPMLGLPHILIEMQWIDTRLPTKVAVRVKGQGSTSELVLSRKFCETNLCYGIAPEQVVQYGRLV